MEKSSGHLKKKINLRSKLFMKRCYEEIGDKQLFTKNKNLVEYSDSVECERNLINNDDKIKKSIFNLNEIKHNSKKVILNFIFCVFVLCLIQIVVLLNIWCDNGSKINSHWEAMKILKPMHFYNGSFMGYIMFMFVCLFVIGFLPFGWKIKSRNRDGYLVSFYSNGILLLVIPAVALLYFTYTNHFHTKLIYDNYYVIIGNYMIASLLISTINFIKSSKTVYKALNMWDHFCKFKFGFVVWALLDIIFCIRDLEENNYESINLSLMIISVSQIFYCADALLFEDFMKPPILEKTSKFYLFYIYQNRIVIPFILTLPARYIQINKIHLSKGYLIGILLLNLIGYIIYRTSNSQKSSFQKDPYAVHLYHLRTFTNNFGNQLLAGGWWGQVRHPNHLGEFLIYLSWFMFSGFDSAISFLCPIYVLIFVIIPTCITDELEFSKQHGATWNKYRKIVPYRLIPFIV